MSVLKIDISKQCNHKLIYDEMPNGNEPFGLDNICVLKRDFLHENRILKKEIACEYCFGVYDNIICDGQRITIGSKDKKWHFIGFAYWGDVSEPIKVVFDDSTEDWIEITFIDWSHAFVYNTGNDNFTRGNKIENTRICISSGDMIHLVYFHDCICEFHNDKVVREIILPNNILVHIFALTIE